MRGSGTANLTVQLPDGQPSFEAATIAQTKLLPGVTMPDPISPLALLLVGATGAVGQAVLARALSDARVGALTAVTRRALPPHPKLHNIVSDLEPLPAAAPWWQVDAVICTLGTTRRVAGSEQRFAAIDRDLPAGVARLARAAGATRFALNSSLGADARSSNFYLRTKGQAEQLVQQAGYPSLTIVRPTLIDTARSERRPGEQLGLLLARLLRPAIPRRYRPVTPDAIACALLDGVLAGQPGCRYVESEQLRQGAASAA
jgi:uncharacterized protein YbjT (DUF2867 family)